MYQWRQPVLNRLFLMVIPIMLVVASVFFATQYINNFYLQNVINLITKNTLSLILIIIVSVPTIIWLILSIVHVCNCSAELVINEDGIGEQFSITSLNPIRISWENMVRIDVYSTYYPYRQRSWRALTKNNTLDVVIRLREGYVDQTTESGYLMLWLQKNIHVNSGYNKDHSVYIISINMNQYGMNTGKIINAMEQHATVFTHDKKIRI